MFHQVEGLWLDRNVKMSDLKGTLAYFARELFGAESKIRLRRVIFHSWSRAEADVAVFSARGRALRLQGLPRQRVA